MPMRAKLARWSDLPAPSAFVGAPHLARFTEFGSPAAARGTLAAGTHIAKTGTRALINTSPEPFSNWTASFSEDALSIGAVWTALVYPMVFLGFLIVFFILAIWLLPKLWRGLSRVRAAIRELFGRPAAGTP